MIELVKIMYDLNHSFLLNPIANAPSSIESQTVPPQSNRKRSPWSSPSFCCPGILKTYALRIPSRLLFIYAVSDFDSFPHSSYSFFSFYFLLQQTYTITPVAISSAPPPPALTPIIMPKLLLLDELAMSPASGSIILLVPKNFSFAPCED